jgi:hypothetical protein
MTLPIHTPAASRKASPNHPAQRQVVLEIGDSMYHVRLGVTP